MTGDIVRQCKDHFNEVLNPTNTAFVKEAEFDEVLPISLAVVTDVIKKVLGAFLPGTSSRDG